MQIPYPLLALIQQSASRASSPAMDLLVRKILARFGAHVQAILFYGSCLRTGDELEGLVDLYVLVDAYRPAYRKPLQAALNRWLPPNVFYLEIPFDGKKVRAKYAVVSLPDFQKGTSARWFHSYLWGRFCQPAGMVYARGPNCEANGRISRFGCMTRPRVILKGSPAMPWMPRPGRSQ
jgi:hypothetical protein